MSTETAGRGGRLLAALDSLTTPHGVDRYLELVEPTWSLRDVRATVVSVRRQTPDSVTLELRPNRAWPGFSAGQHTAVSVEIDGVRHTRFYSMASSAHREDGLIELTVRVHPLGSVSRRLAGHARPGLVLDLSTPSGEFTLPDPRPERLVLISGGSGITPVLSMLRTLADEAHAGPVAFLHYTATRDSLLYRDELAEIEAARPNFTVTPVFTDAAGPGDLEGHFSPSHLDTAAPGWRRALTYVCGPAPLMDAVIGNHAAEGLSDRVRTETFTPTALAPDAGPASGTLHCLRSGLDIDNDGRTLLDQAEAAGLRPSYGCRMGICHTCKRRMSAGSVRDTRTGATTTATDVDVQICINIPLGDVTMDL